MEVDGGGAEAAPVGYADHPDWADVQPVYLSEEAEEAAPAAVVAIPYSPQHKEASAYFRAVHASGERSARALSLTGDMIAANQADYTAWQHRWLCVEALCGGGSGGADSGVSAEGRSLLEGEKQFTHSIMMDNAKVRARPFALC